MYEFSIIYLPKNIQSAGVLTQLTIALLLLQNPGLGICIFLVKPQDIEGILPVATLSIALHVSCRSRSDNNAEPEVTKLSSAL